MFCAGDHVDGLVGIGSNSRCHNYNGSKYIRTANTTSQHFRGGFARFKGNRPLLICKFSHHIQVFNWFCKNHISQILMWQNTTQNSKAGNIWFSAGLNATNGEIELYDSNTNRWNVVSNNSDYRWDHMTRILWHTETTLTVHAFIYHIKANMGSASSCIGWEHLSFCRLYLWGCDLWRPLHQLKISLGNIYNWSKT